jgi:hypothetical protein
MLGCGSGLVPRGVDRSAKKAVEGGLRFLRSQQSPDGLFRSSTYGLLRSGQSLTPFVADALLGLPASLRPDDVIEHALLALPALQKNGALGLASLAPDYPTYSTGLALRGWATTGLAPDARQAALGWLLAQQLTTERGWTAPSQGGWAMGAAVAPDPPNAGHVDLSMTRRVLEGLRAAGVGPEHAPMQEARSFIGRCEASGGGFVYSPVELALNKGGCEGSTCTGYGSATTDGLLAALATGMEATDPLIDRSLAALKSMHRVDRNPGIGAGPLQGFSKAMVGYYRAGAAAVFSRLGGPEGWRAPLVDAVVTEQRPDGSWSNPEFLQKEDDPIIATGFALAALTAAAWVG